MVDDEEFDLLSSLRWQINSRGYAVHGKTVNKKHIKIFMHRVIMRAPKDLEVDHINGNKLDNRKGNLRLATGSENRANSFKARGSSRYKGVCWNKRAKRWQAQITYRNTTYYLGLFANEITAAKKYNEIAVQRFGQFARLNKL